MPYQDPATEVVTLTLQLKDLEVSLPPDVARASDQLMRLPGLRPTTDTPANLLGMNDAELRIAIQRLGVAHALTQAGGPGDWAVDEIRRRLAAAIIGAIIEVADDVLDELRPRFDQAAEVLFEATKLGIHPRTTHAEVLRFEDVAAARDAWAAVPAAARVLEGIAMARVQLSVATGLPPQVPRGWHADAPPTIFEIAGDMFSEDGRPWSVDGFEESWQRWLRLCAGSPAKLRPIRAAVPA